MWAEPQQRVGFIRPLRVKLDPTARPIRICACGSCYLHPLGAPARGCLKCRRHLDRAPKRRSKLWRKFGLTEAQFKQRLDAQRGLCAICRRPEATGRSLAVDHDHTTGQIRGLLCALCNTGLGKLGDSPEGIRRALAYLEAHYA